jgi:hypothetical protein
MNATRTPAKSNPLLQKVRFWTTLLIVGLLLSGATAIPLETELNWLVDWTAAREGLQNDNTSAPAWAAWLVRVREALRDINQRYPFIAYGGDWLAFGHFMIALVFVGAWRDPVRNRWLFDFGLIACALVIPYALVLGTFRGIPLWWRLIDCSFGILGAFPLLVSRNAVRRLERLERGSSEAFPS